MSTESASTPRIATIDVTIARDIPDETLPRISPPIVLGLLGTADGIAIFGTGIAALLHGSILGSVDSYASFPILCLVTIVAIQLLRSVRAYRPSMLGRPRGRVVKLLVAWTAIASATAGLSYIAGPASRAVWQWLFLWGISALILLFVIQGTLVLLVRRWRGAGRLVTRVAVIGSGRIAQRLLQQFEASGSSDTKVLGVFDDLADSRHRRCASYPILGGVDQLVERVRQKRVDSVVIAMPFAEQGRLLECLTKLQSLSVDVRLCADEIGVRLGACETSQFGGVTLLNAREKPFSGWRWAVKQAEDRILATLILASISPVMLAIGLLIKLDSPGPILFRQKRYGLNNELIEVLKFRTMYDRDRDPNCEQQTRLKDPRVTRVGNLLRRTSLDELPQLINVVLGTMSLVGPRPHAISSKAGGVLFDDAVRFYHARHRVKPGITGWAQVCGWRGETTNIEQIKHRIEHDIFYIEHWSLWFDLWIIARTIFGGFTGHNAY